MTKRGVGAVVLAVACVLTLWGLGLNAVRAQESAESPAWQPPRTPDGQPDIQGVWGSADTGMFSLQMEPVAHLRTLGMPQAGFIVSNQNDEFQMPSKSTIVVDPPTGVLPHQPWALERRNSVMRGYVSPEPWQMDTQTPGWPNGIPRIHVYSSLDGSVGGPWRVMQGAGYVLFLYETQHEFRYVPLDGRPQPGDDIKLWMGSSRGHWDGNTLVVESANHNDSSRLDVVGNFHSDAMRVTERFEYVDENTLEYQATIDDLVVYTQPWTIAITNKRTPPDTELLEYAGVEGSTGLFTIQE